VLEVLEQRVLLSFLPAVPYDAGPQPWSVAVGDFNGDGKQDLATANYSSSTVSILLGNGDGTFGPPVSYDVGAHPVAVAVGHFRGPQFPLDLVTANWHFTVSVLLGNGDGSFQAPEIIYYGAGDTPRSVVVDDFNGDGAPDFAVTNMNSNSVSVFLGNGDGSFRPAQTYYAGPLPFGLAAGDFTGDGKRDLVVTNDLPLGRVSVLLGNGDGSFQAPRTSSVDNAFPISVAVGDFNGDGRLDLVTANDVGFSVSVLLGNGDGSFQAPVQYFVPGSCSVAVADFDRDGRPDIVTAGRAGEPPYNTVSVLLGNGDGSFAPPLTYEVGQAPLSVAVGDFNGDDFPDLVTANFESDNVSVLLNAADWPVAPRGALRIPAASSQAAADRSREGDSDRTAVDFQFAGAASWQLSPVDRCLPEVDSAVPLAIVVKKVREPDWPDWAQLP
jgi:hypothetical protein